MKRSDLKKLVEEVLDEMSMTGTGATFSPGKGAQHTGKNAFKKPEGLKVVKKPNILPVLN